MYLLQSIALTLVLALFVRPETTLGIKYPTYDEYLVAFNKSYTPQELVTRRTLYNARISNFASITTFIPGVNKFTDWTDAEIKRLAGLKQLSGFQKASPPLETVSLSQVPSLLNWDTLGAVTAVKDQGQCGDCWAFATVANAQSHLILTQQLSNQINLSEQFLLECTPQGSCTGGYIQISHAVVVAAGLSSGAAFPYDPDYNYPGICEASTYLIAQSFVCYQELSDDQLINLLQTSPVAISISANGWNNYGSGVYSCPSDNTTVINHAVLLVGYTPTYWIIKNSYGTNWGLNGYIYILRTRTITLTSCLIGTLACALFEQIINFCSFGFALILAFVFM